MNNKNFTLSVYEKAMPPVLTWRQKFEHAASAGYDSIEISIDETDERLSRLDNIKALSNEIFLSKQDTGINIMTMCLSGHRKYPLGSANTETRTKSVEILKKAVHLSCEIGIRIIQLAGYDVWYEESTVETRSCFLENLKICVEYAAKYGVILAFETMENDFMNTTHKAMDYVNRINSPFLKVYPDIGNITNSKVDVIDDLSCGAGHIAAAHIKETAPGIYRNLQFGEGHVDFYNSIKTLYLLGVRIFNAEIWYNENTDWYKNLVNSKNFINNIIDSIN